MIGSKFASARTVWAVLLSVVATFGMDVPEFFPEIQGDLTKVTWSHATNSKALLKEGLEGDIMMLEADVVLGSLAGDEGGTILPIMAHPPTNTSDLSLDDFVTGVLGSAKRKGIKLDFKSTEALAPALEVLKNHLQSLNFPVWLNADILRGPALNTGHPVDADTFFQACAQDFPDSVLSVGWTTSWGPLSVIGSYTEQHVQEMIQILRSNNVTQVVTFPIRGGIGAHSLDNLQNLLATVVNSTLTVWSGDSDRVDVDKLRQMIVAVGKNKVYVDVPEELDDELDLENNIL